MAIGIKNTTPAQRGNSLGRVVEWRGALLMLWLVGGALFLGRAIAGRFERPLSSLGLIAVATIVIVIALELRALLRGGLAASMTVPSSSRDWFAQFLPTLGAILLAIGFTVAGAHPTGLVFLWIMVSGEAIFGAGGPWTLPPLRRAFGRELADRGTTILDHPPGTIQPETLAEPVSPARNPVASTELVTPKITAEEAEPDEEEAAEEEASAADDELPWLWHEGTALQELRYMTLPESGLCVAGSQRVTLPAAQQTAVVHTVFHPPFATAPAITIELREPENVAIKAAQILPHGVRWELRAEQPSDKAREIQWAFIASCARDPRG